MSAKIVLNFKSPDVSTPLVDTRVELRDALKGLRGLCYTDAAGQVIFNMPATLITDINDRVIDYRHGMSCLVEGIGEVKNFDVPVSGTITGNILFDADVSEMAHSAVFNCIPGGSVAIAGTPTSGQVLTASNTITDLDGIATGAIHYQWKADTVNIVGATSATFTLTNTQVGKVITVAANYTDNSGNAESILSAATTAVAAL